MKKNFAMRIAACLLVVTMLSLCMVSYTYAKYTTSDNATDSATVAKWGIVLTVLGDSDNNVEYTTLYDDNKSVVVFVVSILNGAPSTVNTNGQ